MMSHAKTKGQVPACTGATSRALAGAGAGGTGAGAGAAGAAAGAGAAGAAGAATWVDRPHMSHCGERKMERKRNTESQRDRE